VRASGGDFTFQPLPQRIGERLFWPEQRQMASCGGTLKAAVVELRHLVEQGGELEILGLRQSLDRAEGE
jgi:hypothetical protein